MQVTVSETTVIKEIGYYNCCCKLYPFESFMLFTVKIRFVVVAVERLHCTFRSLNC